MFILVVQLFRCILLSFTLSSPIIIPSNYKNTENYTVGRQPPVSPTPYYTRHKFQNALPTAGMCTCSHMLHLCPLVCPPKSSVRLHAVMKWRADCEFVDVHTCLMRHPNLVHDVRLACERMQHYTVPTVVSHRENDAVTRCGVCPGMVGFHFEVYRPGEQRTPSANLPRCPGKRSHSMLLAPTGAVDLLHVHAR
jgi:hypothetical protein